MCERGNCSWVASVEMKTSGNPAHFSLSASHEHCCLQFVQHTVYKWPGDKAVTESLKWPYKAGRWQLSALARDLMSSSFVWPYILYSAKCFADLTPFFFFLSLRESSTTNTLVKMWTLTLKINSPHWKLISFRTTNNSILCKVTSKNRI